MDIGSGIEQTDSNTTTSSNNNNNNNNLYDESNKKRKSVDEKDNNNNNLNNNNNNSLSSKKKKRFKKKKQKNEEDNINDSNEPLPIPQCPLCDNLDTKEFSNRFNKKYFKCNECSLVFMHERFHATQEKEKSRYSLHQNSTHDENYKKFLQPCIDLLLPILDPQQLKKDELLGLDFGCGPGPTLSHMFKDNGYNLENYDPYFLKNDKVNLILNNNNKLEQQQQQSEKEIEKSTTTTTTPIRGYDFITCTEAIEHFRKPIEDLKKIFNTGLLVDGGYLLIMTQFLTDDQMFENWHYPRDFTHISFFRKETFLYISKLFNIPDPIVINEKYGISIFKFNKNNT
eukprot:gene4676-5842_t